MKRLFIHPTDARRITIELHNEHNKTQIHNCENTKIKLKIEEKQMKSQENT